MHRQGVEVKPAVEPEVAQFDWPIHTNQQLDLGEEAARASVAGFVDRRLGEHGCRGLVLLGQACVQRVPRQQTQRCDCEYYEQRRNIGTTRSQAAGVARFVAAG